MTKTTPSRLARRALLAHTCLITLGPAGTVMAPQADRLQAV